MGQSLAVGYHLRARNPICLVNIDLVLVDVNPLQGCLWVIGAQHSELVLLPYVS